MSEESGTTSGFTGRARRVGLSSRSLLGRVEPLSNAAWHLGEAVHHRRPRTTPPGTRAGPAGEVHQGPTVPTYPYAAPPTDPADLGPPTGVVNPVLTAADVDDFGRAHFVADPFLFVDGHGTWHLFFEAYNHFEDPTAVIAHAESEDGVHWTYDRVVLQTGEHLSFPYVFRWRGEHYMVPDRWSKDRDRPSPVTLYRAESFPHEWVPVADVVRPESPIHDAVPFRWEERWWALVGDGRNLQAFYADRLTDDDWTPHAGNPVVEDRPTAGRPGGRPIVREDYVLAFFQEGIRSYGDQIRAYEVTALSPDTYEDRETSWSPAVSPTGGSVGWNSGFMHHVDPWYDGERWWCAVDGDVALGRGLLGPGHWAIGIYASPPVDAGP
ncbi:MAG: hypothetical protein ABEJ70_03140 [Halobacteriaceae archaeon]